MLVYDDKLEIAEKLLNELYAIEPNNEEIYIQKANICSKRDQHEKAVELLKLHYNILMIMLMCII
jgi:tetratricopeptide (TPR) repeat protein